MCYEDIIKLLIKKGTTISTAESITGGLIAKIITDTAGSSIVFKEGFVVYSNEAKVELLDVDKKIIDKFGVVSSEVAYDMAKKLYSKTNRDICIATTGNAGPTVCDDKPVGRAYIGIYYNNDIKVIECNINSDRKGIREEVAKNVFNELERLIKD